MKKTVDSVKKATCYIQSGQTIGKKKNEYGCFQWVEHQISEPYAQCVKE